MAAALKQTLSDVVSQWDTTETWREIRGWPNYQVSSWGNVSGARGHTLVPALVCGYRVISLSGGQMRKIARVHTLVANTFLGAPPFVGAVIAHNDGNKQNNRVSNLRWATAVDNQADRARHNTRLAGSRVFGAKLKEADIPVIRSRILGGEKCSVIAADYGVSKSTIHLIKRNRIWREVGGAAWR